ncbi:SecY-interacting protein [Shewanella psychrotolerans]|uniref:SecY-interacting protein n=1 Tax=Shewanella psychrotolerans TaxID=2864206 RepID=UPI001C65E5C8|nr:SecY-interacting protein [Shewanella psychrotolerans]QYK02504.1 SecY-interacting protein [Shewanella psychrotolerans]
MSSLPALDNFFEVYLQSYMERLGERPRYYPHGEGSDCLIDDDKGKVSDHDLALQWQPIRRETSGSFDNINHALDMTLHPCINDFYGHYFAAPLMFDSAKGEGELLQVWNQNDFEYLQQNLIGHLMMKQKLKQSPTWFIGVLHESDQMLVVDNSDGSVWIEIPGQVPHEKLANSLNEFIAALTPRVCPPVKNMEETMPELDHPGIWQRIKIMWRNLRGKNEL